LKIIHSDKLKKKIMGKGVLIDMKNSLKTFMLDDFSGFGDLDTSLAEKITSR
jgi:hypothetical protein